MKKKVTKIVKSHWEITPEQEAKELRIARIQRVRESK